MGHKVSRTEPTERNTVFLNRTEEFEIVVFSEIWEPGENTVILQSEELAERALQFSSGTLTGATVTQTGTAMVTHLRAGATAMLFVSPCPFAFYPNGHRTQRFNMWYCTYVSLPMENSLCNTPMVPVNCLISNKTEETFKAALHR